MATTEKGGKENMAGPINDRRPTEDWHAFCLHSGMAPRQEVKKEKISYICTMERKTGTSKVRMDIKEMAWIEYGRKACEEEFILRYQIETMLKAHKQVRL